MIAVLTCNLQKGVLRRHCQRQLPLQLVAYRLSDAEPRFSLDRRIEHVRLTDAPRKTVEHSRAAGMRVTADQQRSRKRVAMVGDELVTDALVVADVVKALDAELRD